MEAHKTAHQRETSLDHWRAVSILAVLAAHLLPLGPKALQLNHAAGAFGMAIFFTLSGYLITSTLIADPSVPRFAVRRLARIVPLAWLYILVAVALEPGGASLLQAAMNLLFIANWPPMPLLSLGGHFWSLCVEMQFYLAIAIAVLAFPRHWKWLLPTACLGVTLLRIVDGVHLSIDTYYRIDEILAGAVLALVAHSPHGRHAAKATGGMKLGLCLLLLASCHPDSGALNYLRPYLAAALVATTLAQPGFFAASGTGLAERAGQALVYVAAISYALYVLHPLVAYTWLGTGEGLEKYLKRPALFLVLFGLAHLSTFYFERYFIGWGKRIAARSRSRGYAPENLRGRQAGT